MNDDILFSKKTLNTTDQIYMKKQSKHESGCKNDRKSSEG